MKTLLAILSHSGANATAARHWPHYLKADCDILGVGRENTNCVWPKERLIGSINVGKESGPHGDNHLRRFLDTLQIVLAMDYNQFLVCEYDCLFFRPPPPHPGGLFTKLAGYQTPGFQAKCFFHTPWFVDRPTAAAIIGYGEAMLRAGRLEHGYIDRWLGLMVELFPLPWHDTGDMTYTQNTIHLPSHVADVRAMVRNGGWFCHGVKTQDVLDAITEGL